MGSAEPPMAFRNTTQNIVRNTTWSTFGALGTPMHTHTHIEKWGMVHQSPLLISVVSKAAARRRPLLGTCQGPMRRPLVACPLLALPGPPRSPHLFTRRRAAPVNSTRRPRSLFGTCAQFSRMHPDREHRCPFRLSAKVERFARRRPAIAIAVGHCEGLGSSRCLASLAPHGAPAHLLPHRLEWVRSNGLHCVRPLRLPSSEVAAERRTQLSCTSSTIYIVRVFDRGMGF